MEISPESTLKAKQQTIFHNDPFFDNLARYFIGNNTRYRENIIIPRTMGPVYIKSNEEKMIEAGFESCVFKTLLSCVAGKYLNIYSMYSSRNRLRPSLVFFQVRVCFLR